MMDCGATCLRIVLRHFGKNTPITQIRNLSQTTMYGVNLLGISQAAEKLGFRTYGARLSLDQLVQADFPCILHWNQVHFVVLYKVKNNKYYISDPTLGLISYNEEEFINSWYSSKELASGIALLLSPRPEFFQEEDDNTNVSYSWKHVLSYFFKYKKLFLQLFLGMLVGTILSLLAPLLTQSVVDIGINTKNLSFVNMVLIGQLMLFIGSTSISFIRSWIMLHISSRVNISILTDLLIKIMKLPMSFFDKKSYGDIMQRIVDQQRIESFLTGDTLNTLYSLINMIIFGFVLIKYNVKIFWIFVICTSLYTLWILAFMKYRRKLDAKRFAISTDNQNYMVEMFQNIKDIKLGNIQKQKRWGWESLQARLLKFKIESLTIHQTQSIGSIAINQIKGIIITYISVEAVINGDLTLGEMMAIQYIIGMISNPVELFLTFIQSYQDAKISLERIGEIYDTAEEENTKIDYLSKLPSTKTIEFKNVSFRYYGAGNEPIFSNLNLTFPEGKTTAIVGESGSGKTTILKLLLRYYDLESGQILIGGKKLDHIDLTLWRESCGSVLQESNLFADTISNNIMMDEELYNDKRMSNAIHIANLDDFISEQLFGLNTKIGATGKGISAGQKQRLMIARAVYKDPAYIFFDEATSSLDANNEKTIIERLNTFFKNKTVIVVAHRLSTVKNADNIIVLEKGEIVEQGTHKQLVLQKGKYYNLVKNQLELGN